MVKKIYMLPSWSGSAKHMRDLFIRQTPNLSGRWGNIEITERRGDANYHIQMDRPIDKLPNPAKTIYMNWEPPNKGGYYLCDDYNVAKRILFNKDGGCFPSIWFLDYSYDELKRLMPIGKSKRLSCILSSKNKCKGHRVRHKFAKKMCEKYPEDFNLYGTIAQCPEFKKFNVNEKDVQNITKLGKRGNFLSKENSLYDYMFHLTMENVVMKNYFTEKITDALLMWNLPIYWGCSNIFDFLPKKSVIMFDAENLNEADRVIDIIDSETYSDALRDIAIARDLILDKYNFCNILHESIKDMS